MRWFGHVKALSCRIHCCLRPANFIRFPIIPAFILAALYALLTCGKLKGGFVNICRMLAKQFADGAVDVAPLVGFLLVLAMFNSAASLAQKYVDSANENQEGPNFVQVTDNRGTESGWTLNVRQNGQFKTAEDQELTAAQIRLTKGTVVTPSLSPKPSNVSTTITLNPNGAQSLVMSAQDGEGAGTYLMSWGDSLAAAMDSIELEVPGSTTKYASQYNTTFTWLLTDTPTNP